MPLPVFACLGTWQAASFKPIANCRRARNGLLNYLTLIFACQLAGETIVRAVGLLLPGPVIGMVILFAFLVVRRCIKSEEIPRDLARVADTLLANLSLLFVPAGVGIMVHLGLLKTDLLPLGTALIVSTVLTIAVTALLMQWLKPRSDGAKPGEEIDG